MTQLVVDFRNFANAPKNTNLFLHIIHRDFRKEKIVTSIFTLRELSAAVCILSYMLCRMLLSPACRGFKAALFAFQQACGYRPT